MPGEAGQREVIAHYPVKRLLTMGIVWPCVFAGVIYMTQDEWRHPGNRHYDLFFFLWGLLMLVPIVLYLMSMVLRAAFAGGAALWIQDGRLFSAEKRLGVPLAEIVAIRMASRFADAGGLRGPKISTYVESIFFRLASGREVKVWAEFVENEGLVVADLQKRIGLQVVGDMRSWH
jgi:hypothetical protein